MLLILKPESINHLLKDKKIKNELTLNVRSLKNKFYDFCTYLVSLKTSSNHRLGSAGLNALEELLFRCW